MEYFSIKNIFFSIIDYPISYIEFVGTIAGIIAVYLAAKSDIKTWPIGLINIVLFFIIFFQVQLYSDMFLQIYFFGISIYGWIFWDKDFKHAVPVKLLSHRDRWIVVGICFFGTIILGYFISRIHEFFPSVFTHPAAYPYADTFVAVASIIANTLMARRILENWILWILVDILCVYLYFTKQIVFVSFEYLVFLGLAIYGYYLWHKERN